MRVHLLFTLWIFSTLTSNAQVFTKLASIKLNNKFPVSSAVNTSEDMLAVGCTDNTIELYSLKDNTLQKDLKGHKGVVKSLIFIDRLNLLASGSADNSINIWNYSTGELINTFSGHSKPVTKLAYSVKKNILISVSEDGTVKFWDLNTKLMLKSLYISQKGVSFAELSSDESFVVVSTVEKSILSIALKEFSIIKEIKPVGIGVISGLTLTDNNKQALVTCSDNKILKIDLLNADVKVLNTSRKIVNTIYNPYDTVSYFSVNEDRTFSAWKFGQSEPLAVSPKANESITSLSLANDKMIVCDFSNAINIWNVSFLSMAKKKKQIIADKESVVVNTNAVETPVTGSLPKIYAVVVGISEYQDPKMNLQYADDDAISYYNFLTGPSGGKIPKDNISLLTDKKATRSAIIKEITNQMRKALDNDMVIVYMACHGMPNSDATEIYLLGADTEKDNIEGTGVSYSEIKKIIYNSKADKKLLIMDACHSGGAGVVEEGARGDLGDAHASMMNRLLTNVSSQGKNIMILNSSSAAQPSKESEQWGGGHGVFSYYFLKGLKGDADSNENGIVDIRELYEYVRSTVSKDTDNKQWPELKGTFNDRFPLSVTRGK